MPKASIIVPAFNAEKTLPETLQSLMNQSFTDFEIIVVDDGSTDTTPELVNAQRHDKRVRLIQQKNKGLSGARNTGIAAAQGEYIGLCDADDLWEPRKLEMHVAHLDANRHVGVSYSGSYLIDAHGNRTRHAQKPRLNNITAAHIFKRNPVGNGSAAMLRRKTLEAISYRPASETERDWYFDETFRQSEDIEFWLRLALSTDWDFAGIPDLLTAYRICAGGLSTNVDRQFSAWTRMVEKLSPLSPVFFTRHTAAARAYQLRYLARRAVSEMDASEARRLTRESLKSSLSPLLEEPIKTFTTVAATGLLSAMGPGFLQKILRFSSPNHVQ